MSSSGGWRELHADQNLRLAQKMLEQQGEVNELAARVRELVSIVADRERELLELKGSCTVPGCELHQVHYGPCRIYKNVTKW